MAAAGRLIVFKVGSSTLVDEAGSLTGSLSGPSATRLSPFARPATRS